MANRGLSPPISGVINGAKFQRLGPGPTLYSHEAQVETPEAQVETPEAQVETPRKRSGVWDLPKKIQKRFSVEHICVII